MNWNIIIDESSKRPDKDQDVVGYWAQGPEVFAGLCYYDPDTDEWVFTENGESI